MMKTCKAVEKHQKENDGKTDLIWLNEHIKDCKICKIIMANVNAIVSDMLVGMGE